MSFSTLTRDELGGLTIKPLCCRRAYLYGLLYGSLVDGDRLTTTFPVQNDAAYDPSAHALMLIRTLFSRQAELIPLTRGAHRYAQISFAYKQAAGRLRSLIEMPEKEATAETAIAAMDLKCESCARHFLRGVFVAYGTVNDPLKSCHLEIKLPCDGRIEPLRSLLAEESCAPSRTDRKSKGVGLFYKNSDDIQEVLGHLGATHAIFAFMNAQIEHDIRNEENRATNCVTENIRRSTQAGGRQIGAIRWLDEHHLLPALSEDLCLTARLRLENPEASLIELAALHAPPITKSGLNHRLTKLVDFYEKANEEMQKKNDQRR